MLVYCRAPLSPESHLFHTYHGKKTSGYDVPHASSVRDDRVYPCCGLFKLETWNVHHWGCADFVQPFRQQLLESKTAFCGICHKNCTSVVDFVLHHEWAHLCLPLFITLISHGVTFHITAFYTLQFP